MNFLDNVFIKLRASGAAVVIIVLIAGLSYVAVFGASGVSNAAIGILAAVAGALVVIISRGNPFNKT